MLLKMVSSDHTLLKGPPFLIPGKKYRVGRSSRCEFVVNDRSVSRIHAEVTSSGKSFFLKDLGSMNGTLVNGERVTEVELEPNQAVVFGLAKFRLLCQNLEFSESESQEDTTIPNSPGEPPSGSAMMKVRLLSKAQFPVLEVMLQGLSEKVAAKELNLSQHTVHTHVKEIYRKLGVNSRPALLALFVSDSKFPDKPAK